MLLRRVAMSCALPGAPSNLCSLTRCCTRARQLRRPRPSLWQSASQQGLVTNAAAGASPDAVEAARRVARFTEARQCRLDAAAALSQPITVELVVPGEVGGATRTVRTPGTAGVSTPWSQLVGLKERPAEGVPTSLATQLLGSSVLARVDGETWDLGRPLLSDCRVELVPLDVDDPEVMAAFWHSSAHVLGAAMEEHFGCQQMHLCDGPDLADGGFFYEGHLKPNADAEAVVAGGALEKGENDARSQMGEEDMKAIGKIAKRLTTKGSSPFELTEVDLDAALDILGGNPFKRRFILRAAAAGATSFSLYRCGNFVDFCRGPHLPKTGLVKGFALLNNTTVEWSAGGGAPGAVAQTDNDNPHLLPHATLQRVYGMSLPTKQGLKEWLDRREEAKKRDHRVIGARQRLFSMHSTSPGAPVFLPHGVRILRRLQDFLRSEYIRYGYDEVMTPLVYSKRLWETSGHWEHYQEDMFCVTDLRTLEEIASSTAADAQSQPEAGTAPSHLHDAGVGAGSCADLTHVALGNDMAGLKGLKPMNCPGHCLIFADTQLSHHDLPLRLAEFSPLHRNEASGALSGLTRVRQFHQDDAHVFCTPEQIQEEVLACIQFVDRVYAALGFKYAAHLSTRPESFVGELATWDHAEACLISALDAAGLAWDTNEGDGAFYGPKVDFTLTDALGRHYQTATIQLDFQLPQRFDLAFTGANGKPASPVIIHRAILGSFERMLGILIEHTAGKWPLWLSPRQVMVCPVAERHVAYAKEVAAELRLSGAFVDVDSSGSTLQRKIRAAHLSAYNYVFVVGDSEQEQKTVNVRPRDEDGPLPAGAHSMADVAAIMRDHATNPPAPLP